MRFIVAPTPEQGRLHAERIGWDDARVITTANGDPFPLGMSPLPGDVAYAPGWECGPDARLVLLRLRRAYLARLPVAA